MPKTAILSLSLPRSLLEQLRQRAAEADRPIAREIRRLIEAGMTAEARSDGKGTNASTRVG